jgi:hypothetical protein
MASLEKRIEQKPSYKGKLNYDLLRRDNQKHLRSINNIFIETEFSVRGLRLVVRELQDQKEEDRERIHISAPTAKGKIGNITRKKGDLIDLLRQRIKTKEYLQSLVFAVSLTEDYMSKTLIRIIRAYPNKLVISVKGAEAESGSPSVNIKDVIRAKSVAQIIQEKATQRVRDAFYAAPEQYFGYHKAVLGFGLSDPVWKTFVEIKATRDVYVHGDGRVNETYIRKSGSMARAELGQILLVDRDYLNRSVICMKCIFTETYKGLRAHFLESEQLHSVLAESS